MSSSGMAHVHATDTYGRPVCTKNFLGRAFSIQQQRVALGSQKASQRKPATSQSADGN